MKVPALAAILLSLLVPLGPLCAEGGALILGVADPGADREAERYTKALVSALERGLADRSLESSSMMREALPEPDEVRRLAREAGVSWVFAATCLFDGTRITWSATAWDGRDGSTIGFDSYASRTGPSALPLIEESGRRILETLDRVAKSPRAERAPGRTLSFTSPDEDALVSLGGGRIDAKGRLAKDDASLELGKIRQGRLEAALIPLKSGQVIVLSVEKPGFWPLVTSTVVKDHGDIDLPALRPLLMETFGIDYGVGRLLGAEFLYRRYLLPDQVFLEFSDAPYITFDFRPGSLPVIHNESGLGLFATPFFSPGARLRLVLGAGMAGSYTLLTAPKVHNPVGFDLILIPIEGGLEYQGKQVAFFLRIRGEYALGLAGGFLDQGWLSVGPSHLPTMSLGVLFR